MNQNKFSAQIGLVFTTLAWGATFVLVKNALNDAPPFIFAFYRFLIATIAILPFILINKDKKFFSSFNQYEIAGGIFCGFLLYVGYAFQNFGLTITTPSKSAFITSVSILLVPLIAFFYKKEQINYHLWISIIIAMIGLFLLLDPNNVTVTTSSNNYNLTSFKPNLGDLLTFGCAVFFAFHIIIQADYVRKKINLIRFFIIQCLSVAFFSLISSFLTSEPITHWSSNLIIALIITGVIATTFAIFTMIWAQKRLTAGETAIIFSLEPVFAAVFSIILGVEVFGLLQWIGGVIVVFGVMYYGISNQKL